MLDSTAFAIQVAIIAAALVLAVFSHQLSQRTRVPAPAIFLVAAALAALSLPPVSSASRALDERIVSLALVFVLFDGGMHIGWRRFRSSGAAIVTLGVLGTAPTAVGVAAAGHFVFGLPLAASLLLGAALSPTDPATVFSVLGRREISGRTGTILEGESGANDPVGIAIMMSLLAASGAGWARVGDGAADFVLQLAVGAAIGIAGGVALRMLLSHVTLPSESLASVATLAAAALLYGIGALAHGSGFLAVFVAGILVGDLRAPYKTQISGFSSGMASLAEIVAFTVLGLTARLDVILRPPVFLTGLALAALLIFVIRPLAVGPLTFGLRLRWGERGFLVWAGLKGAVPALLGLLIVDSGIPGAQDIYGIVVVVVVVSVVVQGGLVPAITRLLRVPTRIVVPHPWSLDIRFTRPPVGLEQYIVETGSPADGATIGELSAGETEWITLASRDGRNLPLRVTTELRAGDLVIAHADHGQRLSRLFGATPSR